MTLAPATTSTSLIAPASSLSSGAGRSAKTENAAIRLLSTLADRATDGSASSVAALDQGVPMDGETHGYLRSPANEQMKKRLGACAGIWTPLAWWFLHPPDPGPAPSGLLLLEPSELESLERWEWADWFPVVEDLQSRQVTLVN